MSEVISVRIYTGGTPMVIRSDEAEEFYLDITRQHFGYNINEHTTRLVPWHNVISIDYIGEH